MTLARYSTNTDVRQYISLCDLPSLTSDGDPTAVNIDDSKIDFAGTFATDEIDYYLVKMYDLTATHAVKPDFLKHCECIVLCVWLCRHSSNGTIPPGLQALYDERIKMLKDVNEGRMQIPGVAVRADPGCSMSNLILDPRWVTKKVRTQPMNDTGDQNSTVVRNTDYMPAVY